MNEIAIIGPTASGKSDLAIKIAQKLNAYIFSIDSLSIYKEINIASAKPDEEALSLIRHFGINELYPNETFSVPILIELYRKLKIRAESEGKNIVIVGGSSFYLKILLDGLSTLPHISDEIEQKAKKMLLNLESVYTTLSSIDPSSLKSIAPNDAYRLEKLLLIYLATNEAPSIWFQNNPPKATIDKLPIYNIEISRDILRERISHRTYKMLELHLIDEVCYLEHKYGRRANSMNSIGIAEVLKYLDGLYTYEEMVSDIITNTSQLAKRQQTFNRTQFKEIISLELEQLELKILSDLKLKVKFV